MQIILNINSGSGMRRQEPITGRWLPFIRAARTSLYPPLKAIRRYVNSFLTIFI
jgi:hypothetical protein